MNIEDRIPPKKLNSKSIYIGKKVNLRVDTLLIDPTKKPTEYEIVEHGGAAVMIPINDKGEIILIKQYRQAIDRAILELPAGTLDQGEDPAICAQRELQEEIGQLSNALTPLGGFYTTPGFCSEYIYLFLAENLQRSSLKADDDEMIINLITLSPQQALRMIKENQISDAKTIIGIYRYIVEILK